MSLKYRLEEVLKFAEEQAAYEFNRIHAFGRGRVHAKERLEEITAVRNLLDSYLHVHESHVVELMDYSREELSHRIKVAVSPSVTDKVFHYEEVRNCPSKEVLDRFLKDRISRARHMLIETLEQPAPDPEQTQPDQP